MPHQLLSNDSVRYEPDPMISVRNFTGRDVRPVSRLWLKVFSPAHTQPEPPGLERYLEEVFLQNPWRANHLSSLVCEDREGAVVGFIGVLPRRMRFHGEPLTVAVASQLMIDPEKTLPLASVSLLRHFFNGPQDLSFSDGANQRALKMWEAGGGSAALLYSAEWTRVLKPAGYAAQLWERRRVSSFLSRVVRPLCRVLDIAGSRLSQSPYRVFKPVQTRIEEGVDAAVLLDCVRKFSARRALQPEYDLTSFRWLLSKAAEQQKHGDLQTALVKGAAGEILGWYVYYVRRGGIAQVLQLGGEPRHIGRVLDRLFYRAHEKGALAFSGPLEPTFVHALASAHCNFAWSSGVIIQSRNQGLLNAIHRGDAFLSRFEGEWWMRFCDLHPAEA